MGGIANISYDTFPKQGTVKDKVVKVIFHYDTNRSIPGVCIRDDDEEPFLTIFKLEDGRVVLATECQWQPSVNGECDAAT